MGAATSYTNIDNAAIGDLEAVFLSCTITLIGNTPEVAFDAGATAVLPSAHTQAHFCESKETTLVARCAVHGIISVKGDVGGSVAGWVLTWVSEVGLAVTGGRVWLWKAGALIELWAGVILGLSDASVGIVIWLVEWVEHATGGAIYVVIVVGGSGLPLVRAEAAVRVPRVLVVLAVSLIVESSAASLSGDVHVGCSAVAGVEVSAHELILKGEVVIGGGRDSDDTGGESFDHLFLCLLTLIPDERF